MLRQRPVRKLSAVIACYRDAQAIPIMYERLSAVFQAGRRLRDHLRQRRQDDNKGCPRGVGNPRPSRRRHQPQPELWIASAFTSGMNVATGDGVILLDGDLQDPPELIEQLYEQWVSGYDVVYGDRIQRAHHSCSGAYKLFYRVFRAMSYVKIPLDAGDFSLLDRRVVEA